MNRCPIMLLPLLLIGNATPPVSIITDCRNLQRDLSLETHGQPLVVKLKTHSICHIAPLQISHGRNIRLDGGNSTLIFSGNRTGIHIGDQSEAISISNLKIDYDPLPFTQGIINRVQDGYFSFSIMASYPPVTRNNNRVLIYDRTTRNLKADGSTLYFSTFHMDSDGRSGRIPISANYRAHLHAGDFIAFRPRGNPAIRLDGVSRNIRLDNISILSSPGMGIMGRYLDGDNHVNVRIIPGEPPTKSSPSRLLSVNADGVNFAYGRKGPAIEDSYISRQGDDGINLHGLILGISSITGPAEAVAFRLFGNDHSMERILRPGDEVRFLAKDDFHILGQARIKTFRTIGNHSLAPWASSIFPRASAEGAESGTFHVISFSESIPPDAAYIDIMSAASDGFLIRNNIISSNRGHGIVVGASNGQIVGNLISSTTHNSIIVGPNFIPWREGSWPDRVSINGNTIINPCMDGLKDRKISERSSLFIGGDSSATSFDMSDISVSGNRIESCDGHWIVAGHVNGISLLDNIFVLDRGQISRSSCGQIPAAAVAKSKNVLVRGNLCSGARRPLLHQETTKSARQWLAHAP